MKNQKIGIIYLLIIRFVLIARAAPVSEEAAVQPTMTEAASEPEPEIEEIPEVPAALSLLQQLGVKFSIKQESIPV